MSKQECAYAHCTGKADDSGRCWRHRPRRKLVRSKRLNTVNRKRRAKLFRRNYGSSERLTWLKAGGCEVARHGPPLVMCDGPIDAAHVARARGMGGCGGDADAMVALCRHHHQASGEPRTSQRDAFEKRYGLDLTALASKRAAEWAAYKGEK